MTGKRRDTAMRRTAWRRGRLAELVAAAWLMLRGYRLLGHHVTAKAGSGAGEIDLVARRGKVVAFIEVKARPTLEAAAAALGPAQRRRLARGASWFLARHPELAGCAVRFDLMLVSPWRRPRHLADAWRPDW